MSFMSRMRDETDISDRPGADEEHPLRGYYEGDEIYAVFGGDPEEGEYEIIELKILGVLVEPRDLPPGIVNAVLDLAPFVEFTT